MQLQYCNIERFSSSKGLLILAMFLMVLSCCRSDHSIDSTNSSPGDVMKHGPKTWYSHVE